QVRGRWQVGDYSARLVGTQYSLATGEPSLDARVLLHIESHPGCSQRAVERAIQARATDVRAAIHRLLCSGAVRNDGTENTMRLFRDGTQSGTQSSGESNAPGRTRDAGGTHPDARAGRKARPDAKPHLDVAGRTSPADPEWVT